MKFFMRWRLLAIFFIMASGQASESTETGIEILAGASVEAGEQAYQLCAACHTSAAGDPARVGPNLWNVLNREVGVFEGFAYSDALKGITGQWDYATLDRFLTDPAAFAPGNRMVIPGITDNAQRANLIAYLTTLNDSPPELPTSDTAVAVQMTDPFGKQWPEGPGRNEAGYSCSVCHSLAIVKQQGLSYDNWAEMIDWMIEEQGMEALPSDKLELVLNYLSTHFNEDR